MNDLVLQGYSFGIEYVW